MLRRIATRQLKVIGSRRLPINPSHCDSTALFTASGHRLL
jgi:hypothetical protein